MNVNNYYTCSTAKCESQIQLVISAAKCHQKALHVLLLLYHLKIYLGAFILTALHTPVIF